MFAPAFGAGLGLGIMPPASWASGLDSIGSATGVRGNTGLGGAGGVRRGLEKITGPAKGLETVAGTCKGLETGVKSPLLTSVECAPKS